MKINNNINIFHFRLPAALLYPPLAVWADQPGGDLRAGGGEGALQVSCDWLRETAVLISDWSQVVIFGTCWFPINLINLVADCMDLGDKEFSYMNDELTT